MNRWHIELFPQEKETLNHAYRCVDDCEGMKVNVKSSSTGEYIFENNRVPESLTALYPIIFCTVTC